MVLPTVLRDPARDPEQALRRDGARRLDPHPRLPAVARYVESALGALSSALSPVLLGLRDRLYRSRLARRQAAGRQLRADRAHLHGLLLRLFPGDSAGARQDRKNQAAAELDFRIGAARGQAHRGDGAAAGGREGLMGHAMAVARTILALAVSLAALAAPALAQEHEAPAPPMNKWSFAGPFG